MTKSSKERFLAVWQDTLRRAQDFPAGSPSTKYNFALLEQPIDVPKGDPAKVRVLREDAFAAASYLSDGAGEPKPLVLNLASEFKPGGGVRNGAHAQEESLFLRSNYVNCLPESFYPLKPDEVVYSPEVVVFKDTEFARIKPFAVAGLAVAGVRRPRLIGGRLSSSDRELMQKKIEMIFRVAILRRHRKLVLGALGCGAFRNPPDEISEIFRDAVDKYRNYFDEVVFAVLQGYRDRNFEVFSKVIH
ncbi:MAG: TIGR02452 family protein [Sulfobacillus sp.]